MKKMWVVAAAAAVAGYAVYQRMQANRAEQELWAEATDPVPPRDLR